MMGLCVVLLLFMLPTGLAAYYGAILSGMYKDPLMINFRRYGEERRPPILPRFLLALAAWFVAVTLIARLFTTGVSSFAGGFLPTIFFLLALIAGGAGLVTRRSITGRESLPHWYYLALRTMTREERRQLARAWERIPRGLRWRLNGDQASFRVWVDMVRLTAIYGARDPGSPWDHWT